jgi:TolB-like protein/thioredoxin-like negative regulator of GroEL
MSLYHELKRRNVFRVAIAYLALAWVLTEVAGTLFPAFGIPDWGFRFVVILFAFGFVLALIISWAYELTPEGLKREKDVVRDESITHVTAKRLDGITIGLIVVALAFIVADRLWLSPRLAEQSAAPTEVVVDNAQTAGAEPTESQYRHKSIAVLPFVDMSESQDQGWFADGLTEEILNTLVRTPDLMVSSRTSSFAYKGTQIPIPQIASELGVAHVLEGSVRRAGDRIRVTAQLIRAVDGFHVWSETFDRSVEDVISIQEDLAINIAKALKTTMDPVALEKMLQAGTRSVEAFEHYLNGLALITRIWETSDYSLYIDALDSFERAWEADPDFAAPHAQAARIWQNQSTIIFSTHGVMGVTPETAFVNFREQIIAAIENAPDETQRLFYEAALAVTELRGAEAVRLLRRVLENLPNNHWATVSLSEAAIFARDAEAYIQAVENLLRLGDIEAITMYIVTVRRLAPSEHYVASVLEQVKRFPNSLSIIFQAHRTLLWMGEFEEAHKLYPRLANESMSSRWYAKASQTCSLGDRVGAEKLLRTVQQKGNDAMIQWFILLLLGDYEEAARVLKPYDSEETPFILGAFLLYEQFDPRPFPALMSILEREGLDWPPPRDIPFACPPKDEE